MKRNRKFILMLMALLLTLVGTERASAQHTLTLTGGTGVSTARFYPAEMTKWLWGSETVGLSWRYYSDKPRFVGCVGVDLEFLERGFSHGYAYIPEYKDDKEIRHYQYYTRNINSLMLPIVWQPHFYVAKNRLRLFIEAAFVLSFNISANYSYQDDRYPAGDYEWKVPRDNRFGYGLSGGAGFAVLLGQVELGLKAKYNFGYSDIMKNRNKYYSNTTDGRENPFYYTPLRSPLDNINVMFTIGWRFNKRGFDAWYVERPKKEPRMKTFNFSAAQANNGGGANNAMGGGRANNAMGSMGGGGRASTSAPPARR
jgi:hypothetical protein